MNRCFFGVMAMGENTRALRLGGAVFAPARLLKLLLLLVGLSPTVALAQATRLGFITQPSSTTAGGIITPAVRVAVQDPFGNTVFTSTAPITLAIGTNPSGGVLSGTVTVNAVGGVATFSNLSIDQVGKGYTLTAASPGLTGATSIPFNIAKGRHLVAWTERVLASALDLLVRSETVLGEVLDGEPVRH